MISPRLIAYGVAGLALAGALWWFVHAWNKGQDALRELPVVQEQLKAERETAKRLMEETTRLATADATRRSELVTRLDGIDGRLADLAKTGNTKLVEYHYETINGQECAVALLGDDFVRVYNTAADLTDSSAWTANGIDGAVRQPVPTP